jgi:hypothetical protein
MGKPSGQPACVSRSQLLLVALTALALIVTATMAGAWTRDQCLEGARKCKEEICQPAYNNCKPTSGTQEHYKQCVDRLQECNETRCDTKPCYKLPNK